MPALDFPANPTNGQQYGNWVYSTSKGAWQAKPMTNKVTTSGVAPATPSNGDEWYNTEDGNIYVYYDDGNSAQWVQVKSDATLSSTLGNRVTTLESFPTGLVDLVPSSVTVASGSSTTNANGNVSFSAVSSLSLNNIFTSTYTNYRIIFNLDSSSIGGDFRFRLRAAGTDDASATAYYVAGRISLASGASSEYQVNGTSAGYIGYVYPASAAYSNTIFDITNPNVAKLTTTKVQHSGLSSAGVPAFTSIGGLHNLATAYDGISFFPSSAGTFSGTVQVFGYR
jgi:hypothetical protein